MTARAGAPSFRALLAQVRASVHGALANADVPFPLVVQDARVPRCAAYNAVFQNMCVLQDASFFDLPSLDGTASEAMQVGSGPPLINFSCRSRRTHRFHNDYASHQEP